MPAMFQGVSEANKKKSPYFCASPPKNEEIAKAAEVWTQRVRLDTKDPDARFSIDASRLPLWF